jgi:hypothetical protein
MLPLQIALAEMHAVPTPNALSKLTLFHRYRTADVTVIAVLIREIDLHNDRIRLQHAAIGCVQAFRMLDTEQVPRASRNIRANSSQKHAFP